MENLETPEGRLIGRATADARVSVRKAAQQAGISESRWRQVVKGAQAISKGVQVPVVAPAATLARMAKAVDVASEELREVGRADAAEALRELEDGREWGTQALLRAVGRLAKQRREEFGLSRVNFAKEVGLSDSIVRDLEIAHHVPMSKSLWKIEKGLQWRHGSIAEVLESGRRASDVSMDDFDDEAVAFPEPKLGLRDVPTDALLAEVMRRLSVLQAGLGSKPDFDLAASSNREHLEDDGAEG